ncbi:single-stranded-DNA-specific exonuclease RecJ [Pasteurellaceae bacterium HPA106]|uniref:single-stranded-DNA-specific exonuclease RecJ n=1 Tax=Spirabiliibacterium pneumoniae TaxID=221400 RepID=UPI001AAD6B28|nr:single-stranded-DNA-specific exonuclease RecJ [Spirabiliibacterium pneumoniae]MBE2896975.1 single-stranded-DNA-specific exonuclease RecJ [Spirabiliibacterium pneumoniae]
MNKRIQRRTPSQHTVCDDPLLNRIYTSRGVTCDDALDRTLPSLLPPHALTGIESAVELLKTALLAQSRVVIVGDFDADGATSTALAVRALRMLGFAHVDYLVPNRFEQGYGLSVAVAKMAFDKGVDLLITVDNGVSSLDGVAWCKAHGISVLITDHHLPPETLPAADAIVNPNLTDCPFPSKSLAGVGVTFYVMLALRSALRTQGAFDGQRVPNFADLLDLVALGTIADVVPLDKNNRTLAFQGLQRIQAGHCCMGIKALVEVAKRNLASLTASDLGFAIAPRLNAAGRLDNMSVGVELLLSDDMAHARSLAQDLDDLNQTRKSIEQGMKQEAMVVCERLSALDNLPMALALYQEDWHQGVLGILASRIKDHFHRPVVAFTQDQEGILKGSARSIEGIHMRDVLERIDQTHPDMILQFGGHAMAAGLSIRQARFDDFQHALNQTVTALLTPEQLISVIWTDGELSAADFCLETAEKLQAAGPWGQAFPEPLFDGEFILLQQRLLAGRHLKMLVQPAVSNQLFDAIAFNVDPQLYPDFSIKRARLVYRLDINEYQGRRNLQLIVDTLQPL